MAKILDLLLIILLKMSYSKSFTGNRHSDFDHCDRRSLSAQMRPHINRQSDCTKSDSPYRHPKGYVSMCPYMNTSTGCTNLKCPYRHPKDFVPACIFGANCKKRATGECHLLHPDQRGFVVSQTHYHDHHSKPEQRKFVPRREAPPPPTPPRNVPSVPKQDTLPEKDEYGRSLVYDEKNTVIGIIDDGRFISFMDDIPIEVQEAYRTWAEEINDFDLDDPDDDEWESDPDAYPDAPTCPSNDDEWETDSEVYGFPEDC